MTSNSEATEEDFESLEYPPPNYYLSSALFREERDTVRNKPITREIFDKFSDTDGRLINEHKFRQAVFKGGVDSSIRKEVWKLLFGFYDYHSTRREQEVLSLELHAKYEAMKHRWKSELVQFQKQNKDQVLDELAATISPSETPPVSLSNNEEQTKFLSIQSQIYAGRQPLNVEKLPDYIRTVDKDVPRTERGHPSFKDDDSIYLRMLRNILITFSVFHDHVGYAQGMNDIASRFVVVMDNESEAYWCFSNFVERIQIDFLEEGMLKKLDLLRGLLREIDLDLYNYLMDCQAQDLAFCHRWLLLCFLREFNFEDGLCLFEILSSHYLEMNSLEAEKTREETRQKNSGQGSFEYHVPADPQLTFILFVCVAVLMINREALFSCRDPVSVFQCVNSLTKRLSVDDIMKKAEMLFYAYCQKSVVESFQLIELRNS